MTSEKIDFYGKEVTDAIKNACEELHLPQEKLDIEVVETGSTGIFGLIRKKAHIRVHVKTEQPKVEQPKVESKAVAPPPPAEEKKEVVADSFGHDEIEPEEFVDGGEELDADGAGTVDDDDDNDEESDEENVDEIVEELPEQSLQLIKQEIEQMLTLMGYPTVVEVTARGVAVTCRVDDQFGEALTGQDGKTIDSIQYLLRKIVARKIPNRLRLVVDVGNFREKRRIDLRNKAIELVELVKSDGKTQVIPALSPSERRVVHMALQDDKEIRSRSVGDGLFKKILIYKPGKNSNPEKNGGRKRSSSRGRKGGNYRKKTE